MIYEMARITIDPARAADFEAAVAGCAGLFRQAPGCRSMALEQEIEHPGHYVLRLGWDRVDDHMIGFRESPDFQLWRTAAGPFFLEPPAVVHHDVTSYF